jgi:hypothetical protein
MVPFGQALLSHRSAARIGEQREERALTTDPLAATD